MSAPVRWRIKGIDKSTRQMAREAAARSGLTVAEWLEHAIDENAGVIPPERSEPLVSAKLLESARGGVIDKEIAEPHLTARADNGAGHGRRVGSSEDTVQPHLPLTSSDPGARPRRVPNVSPTLIAASSRRSSGNLARIIGGLLFVALIAGAYWVVDWNTRSKMEAETDALAGRSAVTSRTATDGDASTQTQQQEEAPVPPKLAALTPFQKLTAAASNGDARAQYDLGLRYVDGKGVERDPLQGAQWLEKSAEAGIPEAQYHLGQLYQKGLGVSSDLTAAFNWYRKAALQGHVRAQYELGTMYVDGKGTKQDYGEALRWYSSASRAGLAEAHYGLGMMHENGLGVERDPRKAAAHYRSALAAGSAHAAAKLSRLEPALRDLATSADRTLLAPEVTTDGSVLPDTPAKDRMLSAAGIRNMQGLLKKLDLEPGPQDGLLGEKTMEAIKLYQRFAGLPVDGKPTLELLLDLRQVVEAMSVEQPAASAAPAGRR